MIVLPFPSSSLSGHSKGHWRGHAAETRKHRQWARAATLAARTRVEGDGDIAVTVRFIPPDRRGDRINFANRMKPYFDGIADALGVNDKRFLPIYEYFEPEAPGRVEVTVGYPRDSRISAVSSLAIGEFRADEKCGPSGATTPPARDPNASKEQFG